QEVRAYRQIEFAIGEIQLRQRARKISALRSSRVVIVKEFLHRRETESAHLLGRTDAIPHQTMSDAAGALDHVIVRGVHTISNLGGTERIEWIAGDHPLPAAMHFRVEGCGAVGAPQDFA